MLPVINIKKYWKLLARIEKLGLSVFDIKYTYGINLNKKFTRMSFVTMIELCLTLSLKSPGAGGLFSEFGSFWKQQGEWYDECLACRHCYWWHFFPGSWFRQSGGFGRTRKLFGYCVCAVHENGELGRREIWVFLIKEEQGESYWHLQCPFFITFYTNSSSTKAFRID